MLERRALERAIDAVRTLWRDTPATFHGDFFNFQSVHCVPAGQWSGANRGGRGSDAAAQRAGRRGDGYFPFGKEPEELGRLLGVMRRTAEQAGRDPDAIELTALGSGRPEIVVRLAELGFTRMVMFLPESTSHGIDRLWEKVRGVQQAAGL